MCGTAPLRDARRNRWWNGVGARPSIDEIKTLVDLISRIPRYRPVIPFGISSLASIGPPLHPKDEIVAWQQSFFSGQSVTDQKSGTRRLWCARRGRQITPLLARSQCLPSLYLDTFSYNSLTSRSYCAVPSRRVRCAATKKVINEEGDTPARSTCTLTTARADVSLDDSVSIAMLRAVRVVS